MNAVIERDADRAVELHNVHLRRTADMVQEVLRAPPSSWRSQLSEDRERASREMLIATTFGSDTSSHSIDRANANGPRNCRAGCGRMRLEPGAWTRLRDVARRRRRRRRAQRTQRRAAGGGGRGPAKDRARQGLGRRGRHQYRGRTGEASRTCPKPDILVTNNAGPTPRNFSDIDHGEWIEALESNMIAPLLIINGHAPMKERRFGRIVNITSAMVTTPRPHMVISSGPRAGMTAVLKGLALELAQFNITINNLLPERFDTDRQIFMAKATAKREGITFEEARARQIQVSPAKRLGQPREFGAMCAFLCSNLAGYMSGQNIHLDGAAYPALI